MFSYKIVLVGDFGTGKTSLIRRFVDNSFSEDYKSSIGVTISKKILKTDIDNKIYETTIMIWDIEGRTEFKPIFSHHLNGSKAFIIVADITRIESINSITEHIEVCQKIAVNSPIFIAFNKSDMEHDDIDIYKYKNLSSNIIDIFKTSAKDNISVNEIFEVLNSQVIKSSLQ
ncbi:Rab family GTPase [Aliarcobacter cibarius]|uniref:GTP-binding protein n=1 Tax=Aliarcobacter cibarius TaxID=255507 RepID=A0ABY2V3J4_9BACT|nr:Rab family GTPase [Aliarcobacter cibarius]QEZ88950.1 Ras family small GTPase [Aliarcobacter cibarius]TLS98506.1 GTP-binding protein [Aliarcobacter cibarius]TLS99184.1 GTP-binding protein [Aliarcobacter cibarius]TLT03649.1 GTP-binding protein [Aliarcobacter cibarius]